MGELQYNGGGSNSLGAFAPILGVHPPISCGAIYFANSAFGDLAEVKRYFGKVGHLRANDLPVLWGQPSDRGVFRRRLRR